MYILKLSTRYIYNKQMEANFIAKGEIQIRQPHFPQDI